MNSAIKPFRIRRARITLAALGCLAGSAFADQTHVTYNLAAGASKAIVVPAVNTPVQMSCATTTSGQVGVGEATIARSVAGEFFLTWIGFDLHTGAISRGFSSTPGAHIIYCDDIGQVDIQVLSATQIQVVNQSVGGRAGVVMFVY
jgi:hypothetical protein